MEEGIVMQDKVILIIQARTGSSRLPNKVLMELCGKPMLQHVIERVGKCRRIDKVVVATTLLDGDDPIEKLCKELHVDCYRGSENDVLDRYYQAARLYCPKHVVRITADCPLIDSRIIDSIIDIHIKGEYDYTSNTLVETYPDGLDTEVFRYEALEKAWKMAKLASEREHVTPYIKFKDSFKRFSVERTPSLAQKRWTVDTNRDFEFIEQIYNNLYYQDSNFGMDNILEFLRKNIELEQINANIIRNEGYKKSLENDYIVEGV